MDADTQTIAYLKKVLSQINLYFGIFIFCFGILGNILNILVLSQRSLRSNSCVIIFLASSTAGIIAIVSGLVSRVLSGITTDLSATISWICKLRAVVLYTSRGVTFWLIMLATVDRWLLSSRNVQRRNMSSKKNALRGIILITIFSFVIHVQLFYCYEANLVGAPLLCYSKNSQCRLVNDLIFAIIVILFPIVTIAIVGWMTILNIRQSRHRIGTTIRTPPNNLTQTKSMDQRSKKTDQRLFLMLFVQVVLFALFTLPLALQKLYVTLTLNVTKSQLRHTIEDFIYQISLICTYLAMGMSFYVNTLSGGSLFRKAILTLKESILRKLTCR